MKEVEAANVILEQSGEGDKFKIRYGALRLNLSIRPVTVRGLIKISREVAQIGEIDPEMSSFQAQMTNAHSLKYICNAIAVATGSRFTKIISRAISKLELKHIQTLWAIVIKQSDPSSFFFIMVSAKGMNQMKKQQQKQKAAKQSSVVLP
jgi:hypothetical protein